MLNKKHITMFEDPTFSIFNLTPLNLLSIQHDIEIGQYDPLPNTYYVIGSFANVYQFLCKYFDDADDFDIAIV